MTNQEINQRVAKLCGWSPVATDDDAPIACWANFDRMIYCDTPPNYAESLDACREFEDFATGEEWDAYLDTLNEVCDMYNDPVVATALQRCESFLRMKGQWE